MDLLKKVTEQLLDEGMLSKLGGSVGARPEQVKKAAQNMTKSINKIIRNYKWF